MDEVLSVTCPRCRHVFATPLQVDRATLIALVLSYTYTCPRCGHTATYAAADHVHRLVLEEREP